MTGHWGFNRRRKTFVTTESTPSKAEGVEIFREVVQLASLSAGTPVVIVPDDRVGPGRKVYINGWNACVAGPTAWSGGTLATVNIQDTAGTNFSIVPVAQITGAAQINRNTSGVVNGNALKIGAGGGVGLGLQVKGDANAGAGDFLYVEVHGIIA